MSDPTNTPENLPPGVPQVSTPPVLPPGYVAQPPAPVPPAPAPVNPVLNPNPVVDTGEALQTGNAALDAAINAFSITTGATAADMQRAVQHAMEYNDTNLIDVAFITEKFGKFAPQALELAKAAVLDNASRLTTAVNQVHALAGGEQQWKQAVSVFNTNAPEHIKVAVKSLLDSGNVDAGSKLLLEHVRGSGMLPNINPLLAGGANAAANGGALSAQNFQTEMSALKKEAGNRSLETGNFGQRYQQLVERRRVGRQLGL